ncbi:MAG: ATP phosphoribosyltransferase [Armatimonadetes bacterium]|nr:ATP phosphoribosyltransferase [Armatimonadota bacterium]
MSDEREALTGALKIGVPSKGRLREPVENMLRRAGLRFHQRERYLLAHCKGMNAVLVYVRPDDIPVLIAEGAVDLGFTGQDIVAEKGIDLLQRLDLGLARCSLNVLVRKSDAIEEMRQLEGAVIGTKFPNLARRFFEEQGVGVRTVYLSGSVEVMIELGLADAVVDLVETGDSLWAHGLQILAPIGQYATGVFSRQPAGTNPEADRLLRRIEGILVADRYTLLEYNVPRTVLPEAEAITPGFESPTVTSLENPDWAAVRVMVPKSDVPGVMDRLEALGATAILETPIMNCRL